MPDIDTFKSAQQRMAQEIRHLDLKAKPEIFRFEIRINPINQIDWLSAQASDVKVYGANQNDSARIAGIGEAYVVKGNRLTSFRDVLTKLRRFLSPQYPYMQWYGGFSFSGSSSTAWDGFGAYRFLLPRFELASDADRMIFACNLIGDLTPAQRDGIIRELEGITEKADVRREFKKEYSRHDIPNMNQWQANVERVLNGVGTGQFDKVVLARKSVLQFSKTINGLSVFKQLFKVTPNSYHFYFQFGQTIFLGASPERLYKRHGRNIVSEAIAGTSARGKSSTKDEILKERLTSSRKDNHEHAFVVRAINNALIKLCDHVEFSSKPEIISLTNGHHLVTLFKGKLKSGVNDEDILEALHPTPAVAGTPRGKALSAIKELEEFDRGWYAGPLGYVGLDWVEFVVGIRSGVIKDKELSVYAGAGIVEGSIPADEWTEIEHKISNFIKVVK